MILPRSAVLFLYCVLIGMPSLAGSTKVPFLLDFDFFDLNNYAISDGKNVTEKIRPQCLYSSSKCTRLLYREVKRLFNETRSGIGYVKLCRALKKS